MTRYSGHFFLLLFFYLNTINLKTKPDKKIPKTYYYVFSFKQNEVNKLFFSIRLPQRTGTPIKISGLIIPIKHTKSNAIVRILTFYTYIAVLLTRLIIKITMKKINFLKRSFLFILTIMLFSFTHAQKRCGTTEYMQQKLKDPVFKKQFEKRQAKFEAKLLEIKTQKTNGTYKKATLVIPVAVHFPEANEADRACLVAHAQSQIDVINADYTGTNADQSLWTAASSFYPGLTPGTADVEFCIATMNHPAGSGLVEGEKAVTIGSQSGAFATADSNATWGGYMNFLIKDIGGGLLGYSPLAGSIANGDSVVMNLAAYGTGAGCTGYVPGAPYNLGRTVTHELGHFYNLDHTFNGGCAAPGDSVADTPAVPAETYGNPANGSVPGCVGGEFSLTMNYMDYVDDASMYMFTPDQITRAEAYWATVSSDFKTGVANCNPTFSLTANNTPVSVCAPNDGVFNMTFTTSAGYSDNTTFSATAGVPAGATIAFSPTSLNADGNFTMTVGNIAAVATGDYTITITATGSITKTIDVVLSVQTGAPSATTLTYPANNATGIGNSSLLTWNAAINAATYTVQMATDAGFTTNMTTNAANTNSYTATGLTPTTQYFWRVKSVNGCGESVYSSTFNFTTAAIACTTYNSVQNNITIPATGATEHVITSTLNIPDNVTITDINATVNVQHVWAGDVELKLTSPNGTEVILLVNSKCDDGTDDIGVTYDDQAAGPVVCSTTVPCVGGTIQPENPMSAFNGEASTGNWILTVTDGYPSADGGEFLNFNIEICGAPILGIEDAEFTESVSVYPNPNNGHFFVSFQSTTSQEVKLTLLDMRGRLVSEQSFENNSNVFNQEVNFNDLAKAVYILKIQTGNSETFKRLVIK